MADLPGNTQYGGSAPKKLPVLNINPGGSRRAVSNTSQQIQQASASAGNTGLPVGKPLAPATPEKYTPIPSDYSSFKTEAQFPYERNANLVNPIAPMLHQMPWDGGGQMVTDRANPDSLVKSNREFITPSEKQRILGNLPGQFFQVDHIIPLWAGGSDSPQNLQVLGNAEHDRKTRAQSVALTLLAGNKISRSEAQVLAMNWADKDLTMVPEVGENGLIDLGTAEKIHSQWKQHLKTGKPVTFKDVAAGLPEAMKDFGDGWLPGFASEFVKGGLSGLTGGVIGYQADDDATGWDQASGILGNIVGSVIGIGKFSKLLMPVLAKTGWKAFKEPAIGLASFAAPQVAKTVAKEAPKGVLGKAKEVAKIPFNNLVQASATKAAQNIVRNTTILGAYGALTGGTKFALSNKDGDDVQELTGRLITDLGLGVVTGGLASTWKGSLGVAAGALMLGQLTGEEPADSLVNAAAMGAMHKLGSIRPLKVNTEKLQESIDNEASKISHDVLHWWGGRGIPKAPTAEGTTSTATQSDIFDWTQKALANLDNYALSGRNGTNLELKNNLTLDDYTQYRGQILSAGRQLYKRTLPPAEREAADTEDLVSLANVMKDKTYLQKGGMSLPEEVPDFASKAGRQVLVDNTVKPVSVADANLPNGEIQLRGFGVNDINEEVGRAYVAAKARGETSDYVLMVTRPDLEPVFRRANDTFTPEEIAGGLRRPSQNPQKSVQTFAVLKDPQSGEPLIGPEIGWVPRQFSISDSKYALNNQPGIKSGKFPEYKINKDMIADAAEQNGTSVFLAKVKNAGIGTESKKPFIVIETNPTTWALSKDINGGVVSSEAASIPAAISRAKSAVNASEVTRNITAAAEKARNTGTSAASILERTPTQDASDTKAPLTQFLRSAEEAINASPTPQALAQNLRPYGISMNDALAADVFAKKGEVTARQLFGMMRNTLDSDGATPQAALFFENIVKPFLRNSSGKTGANKAWAEMPIAPARPLERIEAPQQSLGLPEAPTRGFRPTGVEDVPVTPQAAPAARPAAPEAAIPAVTGQGAPSTPLAAAITQRMAKGDVDVATPNVRPVQSALERGALTEAVPTRSSTPALRQAMEELEMVGMGSGRGHDTQSLDDYVDQLIATINAAPVTATEKKRLARRALELIDRDELALRDTSMGKSTEAWTKQTHLDDPLKFIEQQRNRIMQEFEVTPPKKGGLPTEIEGEEAADLATAAARSGTDAVTARVTAGKEQPVTTYEAAHAETLDNAMQKMFGANYKQNPDIAQMIEGTHPAFMSRWAELNRATNDYGEGFNQSRRVVAAIGRDKGKRDVERAIEASKKDTEDYQTRRDESLAEGPLAKTIDTTVNGEDLVKGFNIEDPKLAGSVRDLTFFQKKYQLGLIDEIENGADIKNSPLRGYSDAKRQALLYADMYNTAVKDGLIEGKPVNTNLSGYFKNLKATIDKRAKAIATPVENEAELLKELTELQEINQNLLRVSGRDSGSRISGIIKENEDRITEIEDLLGRKKPDGQGGPGLLPNIQPLQQQKQSPADFLLGRTRLERTRAEQAPARPEIEALDTSGARETLANTSKVLSKTPSIKLPSMFTNPNTKPLPIAINDAINNFVHKPVVNNTSGAWSSPQKEVGNPIILGIDTTVYATDPLHAQKLNNIVEKAGDLNSAAAVEAYIRQRWPNSPVTGSMVYSAAQKHKVPVPLLVALMQNDSSMGTAGLGAKTKNPGNVGNDDDGNIRRYPSWDAGVNAVADWMARNRAQVATGR